VVKRLKMVNIIHKWLRGKKIATNV
jgi:hypothetical protein